MTDIMKQIEDLTEDQAKAVLQRMASGDDLFPIESAPRDGTEVIVKDGDITIPSQWMKPDSFRDYGEHGGWCVAEYYTGGMLYEGVTPLENQPTHWKHLDPAKHIAMLLEEKMNDREN